MGRLCAVVAILLAIGPSARADDDTRARRFWDGGRALYNVGNYQDAMREFAQGYELGRRPEFLINIGQCQRKLGLAAEARDKYRRFLVEAPGHARRAEVEQLIADIDRELAEKAPPAPPLLTPPPPAPPPPPAAAVSAALPEGVAVAPPRRSFARRHWWIFPVAGAVAAGLAIGLGVGLSAHPVACGDAQVGRCIDAR